MERSMWIWIAIVIIFVVFVLSQLGKIIGRI